MRAAALLALLLLLPGCGGGDDGAQALIQAGTGEVAVDVEVADSDREREVGLMNRDSLAPDAGMIFLFAREHRGGFWMKDTRIPLSIAFVGANGQILSILDMEPCRAGPCPVYDPGVAYTSALEVNRGAFRRWGVRVGDRLRLER